MKKALPLLSVLFLIYWGCEEEAEPADCAGVAGGSAEYDKCGICDVDTTNDCPTILDIDGNIYGIITIGNQLWFAQNLKVTRYRNGDEISTNYDDFEWQYFSTEAYAVYDDNESNADTYGYLYNWYAVDDSRGVCPEGWHVPADDEFKQLEIYLGMSQAEADASGYRGTNEGGKLKESGHEHWEYYSDETTEGATNESGFTALPGSYRHPGGGYYSIGSSGYFWSSTGLGSGDIAAYARKLFYEGSGIYMAGHMINSGYSVRCVKD